MIRSRWSMSLVGAYVVAIVTTGAFYVREGPAVPAAEYLASRDLPRNHVLAARDVQVPAALSPTLDWLLPDVNQLAGKYLRRGVSRGDPITADAVSAVPDISCDGCVPITFQVPAGTIPVGSIVDVCQTEMMCIGTAAPVLVVDCLPAATACQATVAMPREHYSRAATVIRSGQAELRVLRNQEEKTMGQPTWRQIAAPDGASAIAIPGRKGDAWTLVLDYLAPKKLIRIVVDQPAQWQIANGTAAIGVDGDPTVMTDSLPVATAPRGALIGRVGGSTADVSAPSGESKAMAFFAIGRECVFKVPDDIEGALFLGVNDKADAAPKLQGTVNVRVFEAY